MNLKKNNIVFLDIDGVLNYLEWWNSDRNLGNLNGEDNDVDPLCVERINKLCLETDAKIVVSSDWRIDPYCITRLKKLGLENIIDVIPITIFCSGKQYTRGEEINMWLNEHLEVTNYVIIDDTPDFTEEQQSHFVYVDHGYGLTDEHIELAKTILNN